MSEYWWGWIGGYRETPSPAEGPGRMAQVKEERRAVLWQGGRAVHVAGDMEPAALGPLLGALRKNSEPTKPPSIQSK